MVTEQDEINMVRGLVRRYVEHPGVTIAHAVTVGSLLRRLTNAPPGQLRRAGLRGIERDVQERLAPSDDPLSREERAALIDWFRRRMTRGWESGVRSRAVLAAEIFDALRWEQDGSEAEWWGGYESSKALIMSLCHSAGWPAEMPSPE